MGQFQQLRRGSTPLLILSVLADGRMYGYQIMRELAARSEGYFTMTAALLYPSLHQMEADGLVDSEWKPGNGKRRRKYYKINAKGRKALATSRSDWQTFINSLMKTLNAAPRLEEPALVKPHDYMGELRKQLGGLTPERRSELIEEIASHIESGEDDPRLGTHPVERRLQLMAEMGSPSKMGAAFRKIYVPSRLADYLLVVIPYLLNVPINALILALRPEYPWADVRLVIGFHLLLVGVGLWRRSALLSLFWLSDLAVQLLFVLWYAGGYYGPLQTALWYAALAGALVLLARIFWQNREDLLIVLYGLIPCVMGGLAFALRAIQTQGLLYPPYTGVLSNLYMDYAGPLFFATLLVLAGVFLPAQRGPRWLALAVYWALNGVSRGWLDPEVLYTDSVYYVWILLPVTAILAGWLIDLGEARRRPLTA